MAPSNRVVDALLFDLGGVLVEIDFNRAFQAWANAAQIPASRIAARFSFDGPYEAHERGEIGASEYFAHLRASLGVALTDDLLLMGWNQIFVGPVAEIGRLLQYLAKSFPLYLFSNTNRAHRAFWQSRYAGLLAPFSEIFCSCDMGARKPSAGAFLEVCRRIGVAPARIAFFDDHAENVLGARETGLLAYEAHSAADIREALRQGPGIACDC
ncbi:MAG: HAD family hydrolase [Burkholderiales bacterium]